MFTPIYMYFGGESPYLPVTSLDYFFFLLELFVRKIYIYVKESLKGNLRGNYIELDIAGHAEIYHKARKDGRVSISTLFSPFLFFIFTNSN